MQFHRRRKTGLTIEPPAAMNNFFGTVGSPIKMSMFDRHMEKRRAKDDNNKPAQPTAQAAQAAKDARPRHRRRHSLEGLPTRNQAAKPASPPPEASVNADAATLDVKKKLVLHKEIQRQQRLQREQAQPVPPPKNDILSVHDNSSDDSEDDGKEDNVATVKKGPRDRRRSADLDASPREVPAVEPVEQLKLDGARKAKIPHFMSAWFNADPGDKENKPAQPAAPAPAPALAPVEETKPAAENNNNAKTAAVATRGLSQTINYSDLTLGRMIGEGAFGKVYEGKWRGKGVAVKVLVCQDLRSDILHEFQSEVEIMSVLRHPNICRLLGACMDPPNRALVVELMQRGSLWGVLRTHRKTLTMDQRTRFIYDTAKGMAYLHHFERPILHRDLKSPNLLVDKNYNIKLSDFGLARVKAHVQTMTGNCGTVQWMAPEVLGNQKYTEKADVFSFGIVIWEIMTGECPYDGMSQIQAALGVLNRNLRPNIPRDCPPFFSRLMKACWNRQPELRPSFPHIVSAFRTYQSSLSETRASSSAAASANAAVAASIAAP